MCVTFTISGGGLTANRCYNLSGAPIGGNLGQASFASPTLGGDIDGVANSSNSWVPGHPGAVARVEASAAFSSGAILATLADGRVRTKGSGEIGVLRALDSSGGAGSLVMAVFTSGR